MKKQQTGFTLVEIAIVLVIILKTSVTQFRLHHL